MADKFCEQCDSKGVRHKANCPSVAQKYVSKEDFEDLKKATDEKLDRILNIIASKEEPIAPVVHIGSDKAEVFVGNVGNLPPEFQAVFMKYFDPQDGFTAEYDPLENTFAILVPPKFSNAIPANLQFYKVDKRLKKLEASNPLSTIDAWCKKVMANLRYDKNKVTK